MQSFLQYWKIRERLEEQQKKVAERAAALSVAQLKTPKKAKVPRASESDSKEILQDSNLSIWEFQEKEAVELKDFAKEAPTDHPYAEAVEHLDVLSSSDESSDDIPPTPPPKDFDYKPKVPQAPPPPRNLMIRSSTPITALPPLPPPLPLAPPPTHSSSSLNIDIALTYHPDARPSTFGGSNALGVLLSGITIQPHASAADGQVFVVEHEAGDPLDPQTWSVRSRIAATLLIGSIAFVVGVASSIDSAVVKEAAREFGVSEEVETLATGTWFSFCSLFRGCCLCSGLVVHFLSVGLFHVFVHHTTTFNTTFTTTFTTTH